MFQNFTERDSFFGIGVQHILNEICIGGDFTFEVVGRCRFATEDVPKLFLLKIDNFTVVFIFNVARFEWFSFHNKFK